MAITSDKFTTGIKLSAILFAALLATGCISAKGTPAPEADPATEAPVPTPEPVVVVEPEPEPEPAPTVVEPEITQLTQWTVVEGNNLWGIACKEEVYNVPEQWPLIYKANIDQIKDADLIYPGQVLTIPRDSSQAEIDGAVSHAKNRGAWAVGPVEATDTAYLANPTGS